MARADRSSDVLEVSGAGSIDVNGIYTQDTDGVWKMRGRYTGADYQIVSVDVSNKKRIPIPEEHREPMKPMEPVEPMKPMEPMTPSNP